MNSVRHAARCQLLQLAPSRAAPFRDVIFTRPPEHQIRTCAMFIFSIFDEKNVVAATSNNVTLA